MCHPADWYSVAKTDRIPELQIIFDKRATKYTSPLRKMTYKNKGSYESSPPCMYKSSRLCDRQEERRDRQKRGDSVTGKGEETVSRAREGRHTFRAMPTIRSSPPPWFLKTSSRALRLSRIESDDNICTSTSCTSPCPPSAPCCTSVSFSTPATTVVVCSCWAMTSSRSRICRMCQICRICVMWHLRMCDMTQSYLCDMCVTWRVCAVMSSRSRIYWTCQMCQMCVKCVKYVTHVSCDIFVYVTWLNHMCVTCVWRDVCMPWRRAARASAWSVKCVKRVSNVSNMCHVTSSYVWHDPIIYVWYACDMTCVCRDVEPLAHPPDVSNVSDICNVTSSYVWHDSIIYVWMRVTWRACAVTSNRSHICRTCEMCEMCVWRDIFISATWQDHICVTCVWRAVEALAHLPYMCVCDSGGKVTHLCAWHVFDVTFSYVWRDSIICVWHVCAVTSRRLCICRTCVFDICVTWHMYACVMCVTWRRNMCDVPQLYVCWRDVLIHVTWHLDMCPTMSRLCHMTSCNVWHVSLICVTWRHEIYDVTHSYVWKTQWNVWRDSLIGAIWLSAICDSVTWLSPICDYERPTRSDK